MGASLEYFCMVFVLTLCPVLVTSIEYQTELDLYDLVEEVGQNQTFYNILNIEQSAKISEVRRAYRKLSLVLHPDKNDSPDAETKFRQLVAIYDVLKDEEKRNKYDIVLRDGLPDWRQPIYYYRKVKKMGLAELALLLAFVATLGHYIVSWAVYLEKVFELEEILAPVKKRREKKRARGKAVADDVDITSTTDLLEQNFGYKKPTFGNLLPFLIYRWIYATVTGIPQTIRDVKAKYEEHKEMKRLQEEEEKERLKEEAEVKEKPKPKKKPQVKLRDASEFENDLPVLTSIRAGLDDENDGDGQQVSKANTEWTEDDLSALSKAMGKFPGGTPGRWDRIALEVGRTVQEVTKKVKEMKTSLNVTGTVIGSGGQSVLPGKRAAFQISDAIISKAIDSELNPKPVLTVTQNDLYMTQDDIPDDYDQGFSNNESEDSDVEKYRQVRKRKVKSRPDAPTDEQPPEDSSGQEPGADSSIKENADSSEKQDEAKVETKPKEQPKEEEAWSQVQQKCFESALAQTPKSKTDRWTHIARAVPGKSKEDCIKRYKLLVEHIKKKKETDNPQTKKKTKKLE